MMKKGMKTGWMVIMMMMGVAAGPAQAEELVIESLDSAGQLVFNEVSNAVSYRVEWAFSPGGPWTNSWEALNDMLPIGSGAVTCSVAMCYRVVANVTIVPEIPDMVLIPGGTNSGTDPDFGAYSLTVANFYMDAKEVTKAQWDEVYTWATHSERGATVYTFDNVGSGKAANHPVHTVSWYDCVKWCNARSEKEGRTPVYTVSGNVYRTGQSSPDQSTPANGYRLPTNTEWEYAARGGLSSTRFPWGDTINHSNANYQANGSAYSYDTSTYTTDTFHPSFNIGGHPYTSSAGRFSANDYGLYDMSGNLFNWCWDALASERYFRGGSWIHGADYARCGARGWGAPNLPQSFIGFRTVTVPPVGMVRIPSGTNSGTNPLGVGESYGSTYPETYSLTVDDAFYMDATEVTKAQWDEVYNWAIHSDRGTTVYTFDNAGPGKAANHPVQTVNWYDCVKWCNARSEKEGRTPVYTVSGNVYRSGQSSPVQNTSANGYRLPTNTEWEYAARGGLSSTRFPWGDTITHNYANYYSSSSYSYDTSSTRGYHPSYDDAPTPYTSPVGSFSSNAYGLHDMAGNVWEWCWDASGSYRRFRGGSWGTYAYGARCGHASWDYPDNARGSFGFRAVCR